MYAQDVVFRFQDGRISRFGWNSPAIITAFLQFNFIQSIDIVTEADIIPVMTTANSDTTC